MIRIAQAASSENGTAYGTPPNQLRTPGKLDGELNVMNFYASGWRAVFRAKDKQMRDKIASIAYKCVEAGDKVGYGQQVEGSYARTGLFDALFSMTDPEPSRIKTPVNCDCSSLAGACAYYAGAYAPDLRNMNTTTAPTRLMASGYFSRLEDPDLLAVAAGVERGDIFWRPGHMMIALDSDPELRKDPRQIGNCSACHLRAGDNKDTEHLAYLHPGDIVWKLDQSITTGWFKVSYDEGISDLIGWVAPQYVTTMDTATVKNGNVWLRTEPGYKLNGDPKGEKILVIPEGSRVYLTGEKKLCLVTMWYEVIFAGEQGWASGKYIKK